MRIVVDLAKCQSYGQCVFAAPEVFSWHGTEVLEYDSAPSPRWRRQVEQAKLACPVRAISIGPAAGPAAGPDPRPESRPDAGAHMVERS